jgi:hypothetical protein
MTGVESANGSVSIWGPTRIALTASNFGRIVVQHTAETSLAGCTIRRILGAAACVPLRRQDHC